MADWSSTRGWTLRDKFAVPMKRHDEIKPARIPGERLLHAPGPTHIPAEVLNAMHRQPLDHGDPRLDAVIANYESGLRRLLADLRRGALLVCHERPRRLGGGDVNLLAPGEAALIPATGHFSEQWALQLEATGRRAIRTAYRPGYPIDPRRSRRRCGPIRSARSSRSSPFTPTRRAASRTTSPRSAPRSTPRASGAAGGGRHRIAGGGSFDMDGSG
jgi:hypothetical protein